MIVFGPFLVRLTEPKPIDSSFGNTGYAIEIATEHSHWRLSIYNHIESWKNGKLSFDDYFISEKDLPFEITVMRLHEKQSPVGLLLNISAVLCGIYKQLPQLQPIIDFLSEFQEVLPVNYNVLTTKSKYADALIPALHQQGFGVETVLPFGRTIHVWIGLFLSANGNPEEHRNYIHAGIIEFRPTHEKKLNLGKWQAPLENTIGELLWQRFRNLAPACPKEVFTENGQELLLSEFEWTRLSLMSSEQARKARVDFVREKTLLWEKPKELAAALFEAGLYSKQTNLTQITRSLPKLIEEAKSIANLSER